MGRGVGGEPLFDLEIFLGAVLVDAGGGGLDVVAVPTVAGSGAVGGEVHGADGAREAGAAAAEDVEVAALEVVVSRAHEAAPGLDVVDADAVARGVVEGGADLRVRAAFDDRARPHVQSVHAICIVLQNLN